MQSQKSYFPPPAYRQKVAYTKICLLGWEKWRHLFSLLVGYLYLPCEAMTVPLIICPVTHNFRGSLTFGHWMRWLALSPLAVLVMQQMGFSPIWLSSRNSCWNSFPGARKLPIVTRPLFVPFQTSEWKWARRLGSSYLILMRGVTVQVGVFPSLTGLVCQWVQEPQCHSAWPAGTKVGNGIEEGHVGATYCRVTYASMESHLGHKHGVRCYLQKMKTFRLQLEAQRLWVINPWHAIITKATIANRCAHMSTLLRVERINAFRFRCAVDSHKEHSTEIDSRCWLQSKLIIFSYQLVKHVGGKWPCHVGHSRRWKLWHA